MRLLGWLSASISLIVYGNDLHHVHSISLDEILKKQKALFRLQLQSTSLFVALGVLLSTKFSMAQRCLKEGGVLPYT